MGAANLADKIRQEARAKEQRIETALSAIEALTPDEAQIVYVKLERKILGESAPARARPSTPAPEKPKSEKPKKVKASASSKRKPTKNDLHKHAPKNPTFASRAEKFVLANPRGVRTYEVGKAIGQPLSNVFVTLKLLADQGRVERHGERYKTLWTAPGVKPDARIETIDDAIIEVLSKRGPLNGNAIHEAVKKLLFKETGKKYSPASIKTLLSKIVGKGLVVHAGANEFGVLYGLTSEKGAAPEVTLN